MRSATNGVCFGVNAVRSGRLAGGERRIVPMRHKFPTGKVACRQMRPPGVARIPMLQRCQDGPASSCHVSVLLMCSLPIVHCNGLASAFTYAEPELWQAFASSSPAFLCGGTIYKVAQFAAKGLGLCFVERQLNHFQS